MINENTTSSINGLQTGLNWSKFYATSTKGAVATDNKICSGIGVDILRKGGNAIDAAIAAVFCLGVISPASSGIGGGCYIVIHNGTHENENVFIDSREYAPKNSSETMFVGNPLKAQNGGLAIAVLGETKGLHLAWEKHGSKNVSWFELVSPAAELAKKWIVSAQLSRYIESSKSFLLSNEYEELSSLYLKKNKKNNKKELKTTGDTVEQKKLSDTLFKIASFGPDFLYKIQASALAREIQEAGGIVSELDITSYKPNVYRALQTDVFGYTYIGAAGSSSGGLSVVGILKYMSASALQPLASLSEGLFAHRLVEAFKHVFAIRLFLCDPAFHDTTQASAALLSDDYMRQLFLNSSDTNVLTLEQYGGVFNVNHEIVQEDFGTSHISVLDEQNNAVSITTTINTYFGSKVVSKSTGPTIITSTAQVILNYIALGKTILNSVVAPRLHDQLFPINVYLENDTLLFNNNDENQNHQTHNKNNDDLKIIVNKNVVEGLKKRHHVNMTIGRSMFGNTQFIACNPDTQLIEAVSDPRKNGVPSGV